MMFLSNVTDQTPRAKSILSGGKIPNEKERSLLRTLTCDSLCHLWQACNSVSLIHAKSYNTAQLVGHSALYNAGVFPVQVAANYKTLLSNPLVEFFPTLAVLKKDFTRKLFNFSERWNFSIAPQFTHGENLRRLINLFRQSNTLEMHKMSA